MTARPIKALAGMQMHWMGCTTSRRARDDAHHAQLAPALGGRHCFETTHRTAFQSSAAPTRAALLSHSVPWSPQRPLSTMRSLATGAHTHARHACSQQAHPCPQSWGQRARRHHVTLRPPSLPRDPAHDLPCRACSLIQAVCCAAHNRAAASAGHTAVTPRPSSRPLCRGIPR